MIMVLSGTKDGRELIELLLENRYKVVVSTATEYGSSLMTKHKNLRIAVGRMDRQQMEGFFLNHNIKIVVDATHPYAKEVTENTIKACGEACIPYLRYQRETSFLNPFSKIIKFCSSYEEAAEVASKMEGNILLTTGSNRLEIFTSLVEVNRLYPRILPASDIVRRCEELGLVPSNIIAMQGPFSQGMNEEMIRKYNIQVLVTKDSGSTGGTLLKLKAAEKMKVSVIIIERPAYSSENTYENKEELIKRVGEIYDRLLSHNA